ncbi:MAG: hypothetical protein A2Y40_06230 [Candidatus Margulisbacteria bacterium GWF2_35_9]|nr:MAG: hypothetical protein A2Y40_06230 [Candidatus Margulisbacteria bacterium GWF2_35_9]
MKKIILLTLAILICSQVFAVNYTGFNASFTGNTIQDVTVASTTLSLNSSASGMITFTVNCNYNGWHVVAYGPGLVNTVASHTIPLSVKAVAHSATAPTTYDALGGTEAAATALQTGNYLTSAVTYDLYLKGTASAVAVARAGFYGAYVNLKITDTI